MNLKSSTSIILIFSFVISGNILLAQKDLKSFEKAKKVNTIEAYEKFLNKYPDSEFSKTAESEIIQIKYNQAVSSNDIIAFNSFIKDYPDTESADALVEKIIKELNSSLYFIVGEKSNTIAHYGFVQPYRKGSELLENTNSAPLFGKFKDASIPFLQSVPQTQLAQIEILRIEHNTHVPSSSLSIFPSEITMAIATMLTYLPNVKKIEISYDLGWRKDDPKILSTIDNILQNHILVISGKKEPSDFSEGILSALIKTIQKDKFQERDIECNIYRKKKFNG